MYTRNLVWVFCLCIYFTMRCSASYVPNLFHLTITILCFTFYSLSFRILCRISCILYIRSILAHRHTIQYNWIRKCGTLAPTQMRDREREVGGMKRCQKSNWFSLKESGDMLRNRKREREWWDDFQLCHNVTIKCKSRIFAMNAENIYTDFLLIESMCRVQGSLLISRYHGFYKKRDKRNFFFLFVIFQELSLHI